MALAAAQHTFTGPTTLNTAYDPLKTTIGPLMVQSTGPKPEDKWAGPEPLLTVSLYNAVALTQSLGNPYDIAEETSTERLIAMGFAATATASPRPVFLFRHDLARRTVNYLGSLNLTLPLAGSTYITRDLSLVIANYVTGTVAVSGTAVTGTGSQWQTDRMCVGSRIGFGSTDPAQITTWYEINAIGSDTGITLTEGAGTISAGTDYVIQDMRLVLAFTGTTTTNGGIYLVKGLRPEIFSNPGVTIPAATNVDNVRAVYWLADASTVTNTVAYSAAVAPKEDWQTQFCYSVNANAATTPSCFKYNIRAALTPVSGKTTDAFVLKTGTQVLTGNVLTTTGVVATLAHGPGNSIPSLYFVTTTRVCRASLADIVAGSTSWVRDSQAEIYAGGPSTTALTNAVGFWTYCPVLNKTFTSTVGRTLLREYSTDGRPAEQTLVGLEARELAGPTVSARLTQFPAAASAYLYARVCGSHLYINRASTTPGSANLYVVPLHADWSVAAQTGNRLVTPKLRTRGCRKFHSLLVNQAQISDPVFGWPRDSFRVFARTSGIDDDTGAWRLINPAESLSVLPPAEWIQFSFEFRVLSQTYLTARLYGLAVVYEDDRTDSHYLPSRENSNVSGVFAYDQVALFDGDVLPNLRMRVSNANTGVLIFEDSVEASEYGTWEHSLDGGSSWLPWDDTQNEIDALIRYSATALPSAPIRAVLVAP